MLVILFLIFKADHGISNERVLLHGHLSGRLQAVTLRMFHISSLIRRKLCAAHVACFVRCRRKTWACMDFQ